MGRPIINSSCVILDNLGLGKLVKNKMPLKRARVSSAK